MEKTTGQNNSRDFFPVSVCLSSIQTSSTRDGNEIRNRLLASLNKDERDTLLRHSEAIQFSRKRILYEAGQPMHSAYFFLSGMASMFVVAEDSRMVQIAVVGSDGFVGVPIVLMGTK